MKSSLSRDHAARVVLIFVLLAGLVGTGLYLELQAPQASGTVSAEGKFSAP